MKYHRIEIMWSRCTFSGGLIDVYGSTGSSRHIHVWFSPGQPGLPWRYGLTDSPVGHQAHTEMEARLAAVKALRKRLGMIDCREAVKPIRMAPPPRLQVGCESPGDDGHPGRERVVPR